VLTRDWLRFATILCFIGMHLGFYLAMEIGLFSLICVTGLICFVPGVVWDKISARIECQMPHFTSFKTSWASSFSNIRNCLTRRVASPCILGKVENFSYMEWIGQALCGVSLMVVLSWVATSFEGFQFYFDERFRPFVQISRIDQRWNMFSPYPSKEDGWWVVEGKLVDGRSVDLWTDRLGSANSLKPDLASAQYSDQRHQKYMMNLWAVTYHRHRPHFANFVCRRWNRDHFGVERLQSLQLIFFKEVSVLSTQTAPLPEAITLLEQDCGV
jgi:hypothetical protein